MKVSPAGLVNPGNLKQATEDAVVICRPTHGTQIAMSGGAAAVACAVAEAVTERATVMSVIKAAQQGAIDGEHLGRQVGRIAAGLQL